MVIADQVILATGSYERAVAFPGWTLPGVMSARGAERLLAQGVEPGQRVVVAGYGRWVAEASATLRAGGVNVVEVVDASSGRMVVRAEGERALARVWVDAQRMVDADALVLAYGLLPENQLARLAGCQFEGSQWVQPRVVRDAWMRTTAPGVLVAGDAGGIVGETIARAHGRRAGLAAAMDAGLVVDGTPTAEGDAQVGDAPPPGVYALWDADTVICRCEDVTARAIAQRIFPGSLEPGPVVAESRAGMGRCQGRNCACMIAAVISQHSGQPIERIPAITARPPVLPVPIGALAERPPDFEAD